MLPSQLDMTRFENREPPPALEAKAAQERNIELIKVQEVEECAKFIEACCIELTTAAWRQRAMRKAARKVGVHLIEQAIHRHKPREGLVKAVGDSATRG